MKYLAFKLAFATLAYAGTSWLVQVYFSTQFKGSIFFLASGVALVALVLGGKRYFFSIFLGGVLTNWLTDKTSYANLLQAGGAASGAWLGAWLLRRRGRLVHHFDDCLEGLPDFLYLMVLGGLVSCSVSAVLGSFSLWLQGFVSTGNFGVSVLEWWMGDVQGVVLLTPFVLLWRPSPNRPFVLPSARYLSETAWVFGSTALVACMIFLDWGQVWFDAHAGLMPRASSQSYWMFVFITWIAVRLGLRATSLAILMVATIAVVGIYQNAGVFKHDMDRSLISYWFYTLCLSVVGMTLAYYIDSNKRLATTLFTSDAKTRLWLDESPDPIFSFTPDAHYAYVNNAFAKPFGLSPGDIIGRTPGDIFPPQEAELRVAVVKNVFAHGQEHNLEVRVPAATGDLFFLTHVKPIFNTERQVVAALGIAREITLRKQAEMALKTSMAQLDATLNATQEGICVTDQQERVLLWNQRFIDLWHVPPDILENHDLVALRKFQTAQMVNQTTLSSTLEGSKLSPGSHHLAMIWLSDHRILYVSVQPQIVDGQITGRVWSYADVTDLKNAEEAAHAAARTKASFLANMSHEIRTPMNGVVGMIDLLDRTDLQPDQRRMVGVMQHSAEALLALLNDILDYSKMEAGKMTIEYIATPLRQVAESVIQLLQPSASAKSVEMNLWVSPQLPDWFVCDPTRLRQMLFNLVGNAIKFTSSSPDHTGRVVLRVMPGTQADGPQIVQWCVQDNGIGISPDVAATLFTPFTQGDTDTTRRFGGTGLGLSITYQLARLMGGSLTVQSALGQGSEFRLQLPLQTAPASSPMALPDKTDGPDPLDVQFLPAPSTNQAIDRGQLVLLAEDNPTNRDVLHEQLRQLGYAAEIAEDGVVAMEMWRTGRYALLLTDCHMPRMDGFELTAAIRAAESPHQHHPIIAVTANAMSGEARRCLDAGMDDYLSKPLRLHELGLMLAKWLPINPVTSVTTPLAPSVVDSSPASPASSTPTEAGPQAVWDDTMLDQLIGHNPAKQRDLLRKYVTNSNAQVLDIMQAVQAVQAVQAGDLAHVVQVAHALKSASKMVGALVLGEHCKQIERAAQVGQAFQCQTLVAALPALFEQAHVLILAHLASPLAHEPDEPSHE